MSAPLTTPKSSTLFFQVTDRQLSQDYLGLRTTITWSGSNDAILWTKWHMFFVTCYMRCATLMWKRPYRNFLIYILKISVNNNENNGSRWLTSLALNEIVFNKTIFIILRENFIFIFYNYSKDKWNILCTFSPH